MIQRIITFVAVTAILALVASADDTHGAPSLPMNPPPSTVQLAQETLVSSFQTSQNRKLESKGNKKEDRKVLATESKAAAAAATTSTPQEPAGQQQQQQAAQDSPGTETDKNRDFDGSELVEWITSNGGFIHPNARIGLDPTGNYRGVFVKDVDESDPVTELGIADDEVICRIPW